MSQPARDPFPNVTKAGRLLIILTILLSSWIFVMMVLWINEHGPESHYPIPFFLCAIAPFAAAFFGLGRLVLRLLGLRFHKNAGNQDQRVQPGAAPNGGPATQPGNSRVKEGPPSVN